jgi:hypothetical protein
MPADDRAERAVQTPFIDRAVDAQGDRDVVDRLAGKELIQEPELLLGVRQGDHGCPYLSDSDVLPGAGQRFVWLWDARAGQRVRQREVEVPAATALAVVVTRSSVTSSARCPSSPLSRHTGTTRNAAHLRVSVGESGLCKASVVLIECDPFHTEASARYGDVQVARPLGQGLVVKARELGVAAPDQLVHPQAARADLLGEMCVGQFLKQPFGGKRRDRADATAGGDACPLAEEVPLVRGEAREGKREGPTTPLSSGPSSAASAL